MPIRWQTSHRVLIPSLQLDRRLLQDIGDLAMHIIRERTVQGRDVEGRPFRPLSRRYAAQKARAGLRPLADLTVSGRMLNDMVARPLDDRTVEVRFASRGASRSARGQTFIQRSRAIGAAEKAAWHHELGAGQSRVKRPFFALSDREVADIEARVLRAIDASLER
jgi:hypothetical protein